MTDNGWVCDSCNANNLPGSTTCRLCQEQAGSATGVVPTLPQAIPLSQRLEPPPVFGPSKHETIVLTPVPVIRPPIPPRVVTRPPPPRPPAALPRPVRRRPKGSGRAVRRVIVLLVLIFGAVLVAGNWQKIVALAPSTGQSPSAQEQAGIACPVAAAKWLPGDGAGALLVESFVTDRFVITLCRDSAGQLYYDGQLAGTAVDSSTHISIPAEQTSDGFIARNLTYVYDIVGTQETVANHGKVMSRLSLTRTGP
jgi:hypothetical protein